MFELFSIELTATSPGQTTIQTNPADDVTTHDILVYQDNDPVDISSVNYGQLTINVVGDSNISAEANESEPLGASSSVAQETEDVTFRRFCAPVQPSETQEADLTIPEALGETQASVQGKYVRELRTEGGGRYAGQSGAFLDLTSNDSIWTRQYSYQYSHPIDIVLSRTSDVTFSLASWSHRGIADLHSGPDHVVLTTTNPFVDRVRPIEPSETSPNTGVRYSYALTGNNSTETRRDLPFLSVVKHSSDTQPTIPVHASLGVHAHAGNDTQRLEKRVDRGSVRVTEQLAEAVDRALDQILDESQAGPWSSGESSS